MPNKRQYVPGVMKEVVSVVVVSEAGAVVLDISRKYYVFNIQLLFLGAVSTFDLPSNYSTENTTRHLIPHRYPCAVPIETTLYHNIRL